MLRLLLVTPVTTATALHSNSTLRYAKNSYRSSSCQERLNALLLLCIHNGIPLDYSAVVDIFAPKIIGNEPNESVRTGSMSTTALG